VIDTHPESGTLVQRDFQRAPIISAEPQIDAIPDVTGLETVEALKAVVLAGFRYQMSYVDTSDRSQKGTVISQTPDANTLAPRGTTTVTITVGHYVSP
jgi:beta-lactam-binding protein with PASTA domain